MKKPLVISISGISGSGKTTVANALNDWIANSKVIYFDNIPGNLLGRNYCEWSESGADCNEWILTPIIDEIERLSSESLDYIILDYPFGKTHSKVGAYVDFSVWIDIPLDIALARRILRDFTRRQTSRRPLKGNTSEEVSSYLDFFLARHRDTYFRHIETIRSHVDLIIDGTKRPEDIADEILAHIQNLSNINSYNDGINIRVATEKDLHQLLDIDPLRRKDSICHAIELGNCYIAVHDGIIKGFALMDYSFFDNAFIELLIVVEKYRRCGIGSALISHIYSTCKTEKLFTSTNQSNNPMQRLLAKSGFSFCGQIDALDEGDPELFFVRKKIAK
jgi:uridine kinase/N-acetylglutamate synthase-like GNAT family acetyltransferase